VNLLGNAIRFKRIEENKSAAQVSRDIGKSPSYVAKVEAGTIAPSVQAFARIAVVLNFTDTEIALMVRISAKENSNG